MTRPATGHIQKEALSESGVPFEEAALGDSSHASVSRQADASSSSSSGKTNWSLWPLKTSSSVLSQRSSRGHTGSIGRPVLDLTAAAPQTYPYSDSSSPPSPFGAGQSDSSPNTPPTDPTVAANGVYISRFSLDAAPSSATTTPAKERLLRGKGSGPESDHLVRQPPPFPSLSPSSSRNDIFSSPVVSPVPAPRLSLSSQGSISRSNSIKKFDYSVESPTSLSPTSPKPQRLRGVSDLRQKTITQEAFENDRPNYGRSNNEEREKERERIRRSNADLDFRLCPVKDYLLGEGRHCTVYLGAYRTRSRRKGSEESDVDATIQTAWDLCAIKRLHSDRQSQLLGLDEAFALRRLGSHPNLVGLISMRDEVELAAPSPRSTLEEGVWSSLVPPLQSVDRNRAPAEQAQLGKGRPPQSSSLTSPSYLAAGTIHGRSTSEAQAEAAAKDLVASPLVYTHRRQVSSPGRAPVVMIASPEGDESFASPIAQEMARWDTAVPDSEGNGSAAKVDPPRLLLLLELLPYNLSSFTTKNPETVDVTQWKQWALQLAGVVEWLHSKGCVHADLKPENILLTTDLKVKLCDFNSALFPSPNTPLTDGLGLGTPAYGAPELASSSTGFSFPVDVWSLGAILYSVAVGVEPFRKARSMIDILHRKRSFFESEENDRIASLSVAEGRAASISGGSTTASRNGSLRGKRKGDSDYTSTTVRPSSALQRQASSESVSSSVMLSGSSRRTPTVQAINLLLDPGVPVGVFIPPWVHSKNSAPWLQHKGNHEEVAAQTESQPATAIPVPPSVSTAGHHRATSLGKAQASSLLSPNAARRSAAVSKPTVLRRTTSYTGNEGSNEVANGGDEESISPPPTADIVPPVSMHHQQQEEQLLEQQQRPNDERLSYKRDSAGLRLAVTAAFAQSKRAMQRAEGEDRLLHQMQGDENLSSTAELMKPYKDGSPALILPGGGRLPDEARNLLERMLSADADRRPTAAQVRQKIEALSGN